MYQKIISGEKVQVTPGKQNWYDLMDDQKEKNYEHQAAPAPAAAAPAPAPAPLPAVTSEESVASNVFSTGAGVEVKNPPQNQLQHQPPNLPSDYKRWTSEQVADWLGSKDDQLKQYKHEIVRNQIAGKFLEFVDGETLKSECKVEDSDHCKKIMNLITKLIAAAQAAEAAEAAAKTAAKTAAEAQAQAAAEAQAQAQAYEEHLQWLQQQHQQHQQHLPPNYSDFSEDMDKWLEEQENASL